MKAALIIAGLMAVAALAVWWVGNGVRSSRVLWQKIHRIRRVKSG